MSNRNLMNISDFIPAPKWSRENQEDFIGFLEGTRMALESEHHSLYRMVKMHAPVESKQKTEALGIKLGAVLLDLHNLIMEEKLKLHRMPEEEI